MKRPDVNYALCLWKAPAWLSKMEWSSSHTKVEFSVCQEWHHLMIKLFTHQICAFRMWQAFPSNVIRVAIPSPSNFAFLAMVSRDNGYLVHAPDMHKHKWGLTMSVGLQALRGRYKLVLQSDPTALRDRSSAVWVACCMVIDGNLKTDALSNDVSSRAQIKDSQSRGHKPWLANHVIQKEAISEGMSGVQCPASYLEEFAVNVRLYEMRRARAFL